jgi:hypothetical protein
MHPQFRKCSSSTPPRLYGALLVQREMSIWACHVIECISRSAVVLVILPILLLALFGAISNPLAFTAGLELFLFFRQLGVQFPACLACLSIPVVFVVRVESWGGKSHQGHLPHVLLRKL